MINATLHSLSGFFNSINTGFGVIGTKISDCMLPALFNQFIISVKDTALLFVIVVNEITKQIQNLCCHQFQDDSGLYDRRDFLCCADIGTYYFAEAGRKKNQGVKAYDQNFEFTEKI